MLPTYDTLDFSVSRFILNVSNNFMNNCTLKKNNTIVERYYTKYHFSDYLPEPVIKRVSNAVYGELATVLEFTIQLTDIKVPAMEHINVDLKESLVYISKLSKEKDYIKLYVIIFRDNFDICDLFKTTKFAGNGSTIKTQCELLHQIYLKYLHDNESNYLFEERDIYHEEN